MKFKSLVLSVSAALFLSGCGGQEDKPKAEVPSDPNESYHMRTLDRLFASEMGRAVQFNINDLVIGGGDHAIKWLSESTDLCGLSYEPSGQTKLTINHVGRCDYDYSAISHDGIKVHLKLHWYQVKKALLRYLRYRSLY
ncbi:hypothetical protein D1115_03665 [Vibrio alfacsensis]|uniref:Lipoprotein n=1 Tax=Vibrio alfacsensis TaxID=1074311 RepID=A0ABM6YRW6_9VIBR|nr:hypothetical protein [Vibrio alfacsensis]AXY00463.1 hypothetical protein D1115_03665 [Vibrio alfacsensis]